jgi:hypothetical protein
VSSMQGTGGGSKLEAGEALRLAYGSPAETVEAYTGRRKGPVASCVGMAAAGVSPPLVVLNLIFIWPADARLGGTPPLVRCGKWWRARVGGRARTAAGVDGFGAEP